MKLYKTYSFRDNDPVIDLLRTAIKDRGVKYSHIEAESGVTVNTLYNWFSGTTKRPQFATAKAVARAIGYDFQLTKRHFNQSHRLKLVKGGKR